VLQIDSTENGQRYICFCLASRHLSNLPVKWLNSVVSRLRLPDVPLDVVLESSGLWTPPLPLFLRSLATRSSAQELNSNGLMSPDFFFSRSRKGSFKASAS